MSINTDIANAAGTAILEMAMFAWGSGATWNFAGFARMAVHHHHVKAM
jgi:hypothetical protein